MLLDMQDKLQLWADPTTLDQRAGRCTLMPKQIWLQQRVSCARCDRSPGRDMGHDVRISHQCLPKLTFVTRTGRNRHALLLRGRYTLPPRLNGVRSLVFLPLGRPHHYSTATH